VIFLNPRRSAGNHPAVEDARGGHHRGRGEEPIAAGVHERVAPPRDAIEVAAGGEPSGVVVHADLDEASGEVAEEVVGHGIHAISITTLSRLFT